MGEKHPGYAQALANLAGLYNDQGNYVKALPLAVEAGSILKQALGENHPDYARVLNLVALLHQGPQGEYVQAEPLFVEVLAIQKKAVGDKHHDYAPAADNLALPSISNKEPTRRPSP